MSQHSATFTWPPSGAHDVHVTGTFDNWSGNTFRLDRRDNGWFEGRVPINFGDKCAYKYVVDGNWMTREDEAKEWDYAGNMNNVYTAPHQPPPPSSAPVQSEPQQKHVEPSTLLASAAPGATTHEHDSAPSHAHPDHTLAPASVLPSKEIDPAVNSSTQAELVAKEHDLVGSASTDPVYEDNAPKTTNTIAESSTIDSGVVSPAPATTTGTGTAGGIVETAKSTVDSVVQKVSSGLEGLSLGAPIGGYGNPISSLTGSSSQSKGLSSEAPSAADYPATNASNDIVKGSASMPNAASALAVSPEAPTTTTTSHTTSIGNRPTAASSTAQAKEEAHSVSENAQAIGAGFFGAVLGGLAVVASKAGEVVHQATGVDLLHTDPVSVEDAKKAGIDVDHLPQSSGPVHAPSATLPPVPTKDFQAVPKEDFLSSVSPSVPSKSINDAPSTSSGPSFAPLASFSPAPAPSVIHTAPPPPPKQEIIEDRRELAPKESLNESSLPNGNSNPIIPSDNGTASGSTADKAVDVFASNNQEKNEKYKTDLPAPHETAKSNHSHVPQPKITTLHESIKDRTAPSVTDAANKPVSSDPGVDPKEQKDQAAAETAQTTASGYPLPSTIPFNGTAEPSRSYIKKDAAPAASGLPLSQTQVPTSGKDAIAPSTPAKSAAVSPPIAAAPIAPTTPANKRASVFGTASPASTAPSTPAKSHVKESSAASSNTDVRKRKSSFFAKVKSAFHKDKSA